MAKCKFYDNCDQRKVGREKCENDGLLAYQTPASCYLGKSELNSQLEKIAGLVILDLDSITDFPIHIR